MLLSKTPTPDSLASDLANAQAKRNAAVAKANDQLAAVRDDVIATGVNKIDAIVALQAELAAEKAALEQTVQDARIV